MSSGGLPSRLRGQSGGAQAEVVPLREAGGAAGGGAVVGDGGLPVPGELVQMGADRVQPVVGGERGRRVGEHIIDGNPRKNLAAVRRDREWSHGVSRSASASHAASGSHRQP